MSYLHAYFTHDPARIGASCEIVIGLGCWWSPCPCCTRTSARWKLLAWVPGDQDLEDVVRDHWQSPGHRKERLRLIHRLLDLMASKKIRVTILSGDVHVACLGAIESERLGRRGQRAQVINQLTSAGILIRASPGSSQPR